MSLVPLENAILASGLAKIHPFSFAVRVLLKY